MQKKISLTALKKLVSKKIYEVYEEGKLSPLEFSLSFMGLFFIFAFFVIISYSILVQWKTLLYLTYFISFVYIFFIFSENLLEKHFKDLEKKVEQVIVEIYQHHYIEEHNDLDNIIIEDLNISFSIKHSDFTSRER